MIKRLMLGMPEGAGQPQELHKKYPFSWHGCYLGLIGILQFVIAAKLVFQGFAAVMAY